MKRMSKKVNVSDLYVGFKMAELEYLIKPFEQYSSFGDVLHMMVVNPERVLLTIDENGSYVNAVTRRKIRISEAKSSFHTNASVMSTLRAQVADPDFTEDKRIAKSLLKDYKENEVVKLNQVGLVTPFREYVKNMLHMDLPDEISLARARYLLALISVLHCKKVTLSEDAEKAEEQIDILKGNKPNKKKRL